MKEHTIFPFYQALHPFAHSRVTVQKVENKVLAFDLWKKENPFRYAVALEGEEGEAFDRLWLGHK